MNDLDAPPWAAPRTPAAGDPPAFDPTRRGFRPRRPGRRRDLRRVGWWLLAAVAGVAIALMVRAGVDALRRPVEDPAAAIAASPSSSAEAPAASTAPSDGAQPETAGAASGGDAQAEDAPTGADALDRDAAAAFATRFAHDVLTWDAATPDVRAERLAQYLAEGVDPQVGWDGSGTQVAVLALPVAVEPSGPERAVVVVAVEITGREAPRWVHLAVPIAADDDGGLTVTAPPAYVPAPARADAAAADLPAGDDAATGDVRALLERVLPAFAADAVVEVEDAVADGAQLRGLATPGLRFEEVVDLVVPVGGDERAAVVDVRWFDEVTSSRFVQRYTAVVVREDGGWRVRGLAAAPA